MSLTEYSIVQGVIQEVYIPEGDNNIIKQIINQDIIIYVLGIPEIANTASIQTFIQTNNDIGNDNSVSQSVKQNLGDFPLFFTHFTQPNLTVDPDNLTVDFNRFLNNDRVLDALQFNNQQIYIEGDNNILDLYTEQIIYDLSWYDNYWFDQSYKFNDIVTFNDFLTDFAGDRPFDSIQFGLQDIRIFGGNSNHITQELNQTLATFILLDETFVEQLQENSSDLPPVQFVVQENFLDTNHNSVEQIINQNIKFDFSFTKTGTKDLNTLTGKELTDPQFDIDEFILPILDNTDPFSPRFSNHEVLANEKNQQITEILGNKNTDTKNTSQITILDTPNETIFGTPHNDIFKVGTTDGFDGLNNSIFLGNGNDLVDISQSLSEFVNLPIIIPTNNRIYVGNGNDKVIAKIGDTVFGGNGKDTLKTTTGGSDNRFYGGKGNDTISVGTRDIAFGNSGNDILDASSDLGKNRLYGNTGNDTFYLGVNDELYGGKGNDIFYVGKNGDNIISGGVGKDIFWVITEEIPTKPNTITDFNLAKDIIGIGGLGRDPSLSFQSDNQGNTILGVNEYPDIAIFLNIKPSQLENAKFIFN
jgi:Ca2+-binding RTX toxin-like protein